MAVLTVSRQQGSGGSTVARLVADELRFRLLDRELVDAVAERAGVRSETARFLDERAHGWAYGLIYSILLGFQGQAMTEESYRILASRLIREVASHEDVVILGRAGQVVLGAKPGTLHVHVVAPLADRIGRVARNRGVSADDARKIVRESDESRRRYVWGISQREWNDPTLYDLTVSTHRIPPPEAARLVADAARRIGLATARPRVIAPAHGLGQVRRTAAAV